jgi:RND family efflux transporter MFP subunit
MASNSKSLLLRGIFIVALLACAGVYTASLMRPTATVARVKPGIAANAVSGSVIVQAEYGSEIRSEIGGRVLETSLELDRRVTSGSVLVKLDTGDLLLEIERTRNEYESAKKRRDIGSQNALDLEAAKEQLALSEQQNKQGLLSDAELVKLRRTVRGIEQRLATEQLTSALALEELKNALEVLKRKLDKMTIVAPFDGIVTRLDIRKGDLISPGASIARLIAISRKIEARISQENIAGVKPGQKAIVQFLPYDIQQFDAVVTQVLSTADPDTQRYIAYLDVKIDPSKIIPGITGEVSIILAEHQAKTNVPRRALFGDKQVFVVNDDRVELRKVKTGFVSMTAIEILEGLAEGEWVIVDKQEQFSVGKRVRSRVIEDTRWQ